MITYSQRLIDFLGSIKNGNTNASVADQALLSEAQTLDCVVTNDDVISLTERGEVVSRMTVYYTWEPRFTSSHWRVLGIAWLLGALILQGLEGSGLIGFGVWILGQLLLGVFAASIGFYVGLSGTKRRVQEIRTKSVHL